MNQTHNIHHRNTAVPTILGPDGAAFSTKVQLPEPPKVIIPELFKLSATTSAQAIAIPHQEELSRLTVTERPTNYLQTLALELGTTEPGILHLINNDTRSFIDSVYLNLSKKLKVGLCSLSLINSVLQNKPNFTIDPVILNDSKQVDQLLDEVQNVYQVIKSATNETAKQGFLKSVLFLLKAARLKDSKEVLYSEKFHDFMINEFINEQDPNCQIYCEEFLKAYIERTNEAKAHKILNTINKQARLASGLAQELFIQYPQLKNKFSSPNLELKNKSATEIIDNRGALAIAASNQTEILTASGTQSGNVGFEIEMKLSGNEYKRKDFREIEDKYRYFCNLDKDCVGRSSRVKTIEGKLHWVTTIGGYSNHYELRSRDKGFRLNQLNFPVLFKLIKNLTFNPRLLIFGSNHIHVDKLNDEKLAPKFSIINFRRANHHENSEVPYDKGWEVASIPLITTLHPEHRNKQVSFFFDTASFYDQMQTVNGLYDIEAKDRDLEEFNTLIRPQGSKSIAAFKQDLKEAPLDCLSKKTQDLLCKFYIFTAKKYHREDLIPNILRAWKNFGLPNISDIAYQKLFRINNLQLKAKDLSNLQTMSLVTIANEFLGYLALFKKRIKDPNNKILETLLKPVIYHQGKRYTEKIPQIINLEGKLDIIASEIKNFHQVNELTLLLEACKQKLTLQEAIEAPYLEHFSTLYKSGLIKLTDCTEEDLKLSIAKRPQLKTILLKDTEKLDIDNDAVFQKIREALNQATGFTDGLEAVSNVSEVKDNKRLLKLIPGLRKKRYGRPLVSAVLAKVKNLSFEELEKYQISISEFPPDYEEFNLCSFEVLQQYYEKHKATLDDREKALLLGDYAFFSYKGKDQYDYPYLRDLIRLQNLHCEHFLRLGRIDLNHPVMQEHLLSLIKQLKPKEEAEAIIELGDQLTRRQSVKFTNLCPQTTNPQIKKLSSVLRWFLVALNQINAADIPLKVFIEDLLNFHTSSIGLAYCRSLIDSLRIIKTQNHQLNLDEYIELNCLINIHKQLNFIRNRSNLGIVNLKKLIAAQLSIKNLSPEQIKQLNDANRGFRGPNLDKFYLIEAGKLKPHRKFKLENTNLRTFLTELSDNDLVIEDHLAKHLEEFTIQELFIFIQENPYISEENIAKLVPRVIGAANRSLEFNDEIKDLCTDISVHPNLRREVLKSVSKRSIGEYVRKHGPITAKV